MLEIVLHSEEFSSQTAFNLNFKRLQLCEQLSWQNSWLMVKEGDLSFPLSQNFSPSLAYTAPFHTLVCFISPAGNHLLFCWTGMVFCQMSWTNSWRFQRMLKLADGHQQYCDSPPLGTAGCCIGTFSVLDLQPKLLLIPHCEYQTNHKAVIKEQKEIIMHASTKI